jgi:hypothetical protein
MHGATVAGGAAVGASGLGWGLSALWLLGRFWRAIFAMLITALIVVVVDPGAAPHDFAKPVPAGTIKGSSISGGPCDTFGGVDSAVETNDSGPYPSYSVTCNDGVTTTWAQP